MPHTPLAPVHNSIVWRDALKHAFLLAVFYAMGVTSAVEAHSWYPKECCSNQDCMPADDISSDEAGNRIVTVGHYRIPIPDRMLARSSPDNRIHICFRPGSRELHGDSPIPQVFCVFLPHQS